MFYISLIKEHLEEYFWWGNQGCIQRGFASGHPVWDTKLLSQINEKLNILKSNFE